MKKTLKKGLIIQIAVVLAFFVGMIAMGCAQPRDTYIFQAITLDQEAPFEYFKTEFGSIADLKETAHDVSRQVQTEGAVLLMNENVGGRPALPLAPRTDGSPTRLSLFDVTSVDPIWGGMGSGMAAVTGARPANSPAHMPGTINATGGFEATGKYGIFDSPSFPVYESRQSWRTSFEDAGFEINERLWDFYDGLPRATSSAQSGNTVHPVLRGATTGSHMATFNIGGTTWEHIQPHGAADPADVAIFFLGRMGGEDFDRQMLSWDQGVPLPSHLGGLLNDHGNTERSYLRLSDRERTVLPQLAALRANGTFGRLILVINASNQPELDWLTQGNEFNFDAAVWVGGLGQDGICGVVDLLTGEENFSGRLPKMFWNRHADNPVMANFGSFTFGTGAMNRTPQGGGGWNSGEPMRYVVYQEGMYLGYRYAETRYADVVRGRANALANGTWEGNNFSHSGVVAFPFGFGLSYTTFEYSNFSIARRDITAAPVRPAAGNANVEINKTFYDVSVTVTNRGAVAGRETVKVYLQRPYTQYHIDNRIEIPAIELVGFAKTPLLAPGQSHTFTGETAIVIDEQYFAAFDAWGAETFVATGGDYFLAVANGPGGAHQALNNILANKGYTVANGMTANGTANMAIRIGHDTSVSHDFGASTTALNAAGRTKYAISRITGVRITNLFDHTDINRFEAAQTEPHNVNEVIYISRNNWAGTTRFVNPLAREAAQTNQVLLHRTAEMADLMLQERSHVNQYVPGAYPTFGAQNNIMFADMAVRNPDGTLKYSFTDPKWGLFLDQLTWNDYVWLLSDGLRRTMDVATVGKPRSNEVNGPIGFSPRYGMVGNTVQFRHYSFRDPVQFPGDGFYVNFGVGEKDPGVVGFANIGVFWVPDFYGQGQGAFIPRRDTDWHRDLYRDTFGREMTATPSSELAPGAVLNTETGAVLDPDHIAYTTSFPSNPIVAATFNVDLIERLGNMIGEDALWAGYSGIYATGLNILRSAHLGRVFEYFSECGLLTGLIASAWSRGVQAKGTYVYNKHFVLNEQELSRYGISQFINEQTLREIYLRAFEIPIVNDNARALMTTLARVGIEYGPASYALMTSWLRGEVGFTGFTVTDWWFGHHHLENWPTGEAFNFNTGYYMNLSRTLLAGNDLPDGVIGHAQLDFFRPEGEPRSAVRSSSTMHSTADRQPTIRTHVDASSPGPVGQPWVPVPMSLYVEGIGYTDRVHNAAIAQAMRTSAHRIFYTTANSNLSNALFSDVRVIGVSTTVRDGGCGSAVIVAGSSIGGLSGSAVAAIIAAAMAGLTALGFAAQKLLTTKKAFCGPIQK